MLRKGKTYTRKTFSTISKEKTCDSVSKQNKTPLFICDFEADIMMIGVSASDQAKPQNIKNVQMRKENPSYLFLQYYHGIKGGFRQTQTR